jgi:hypothetical protein
MIILEDQQLPLSGMTPHLSSRPRMVLFPEPLLPTSARLWPASMRRFTSCPNKTIPRQVSPHHKCRPAGIPWNTKADEDPTSDG